jgi:hypothetical protein
MFIGLLGPLYNPKSLKELLSNHLINSQLAEKKQPLTIGYIDKLIDILIDSDIEIDSNIESDNLRVPVRQQA